MFLKKAVRAKEINGTEYHLTSPDESLTPLNREMLEQRWPRILSLPWCTGYKASARLPSLVLAHPYLLKGCSGRERAGRFLKCTAAIACVFDTRFVKRTETFSSWRQGTLLPMDLQTQPNSRASLARIPKYRVSRSKHGDVAGDDLMIRWRD